MVLLGLLCDIFLSRCLSFRGAQRSYCVVACKPYWAHRMHTVTCSMVLHGIGNYENSGTASFVTGKRFRYPTELAPMEIIGIIEVGTPPKPFTGRFTPYFRRAAALTLGMLDVWTVECLASSFSLRSRVVHWQVPWAIFFFLPLITRAVRERST